MNPQSPTVDGLPNSATDEAAAGRFPECRPNSIRVVTWNIHGSVGAGWRCDPQATLAVVRRLRPDVLALQEVDGRTHLGRRSHAFERLREGLGGRPEQVAEARLLKGGDGRDYGHLLWSRWPLSSAVVEPLPGGRFEPRAAIDTLCPTPFGPLRLLAVHLGLLPQDRRRQAERLAQLATDAAGPTLVLGDLNEWRTRGGVHQRLHAVLPVCVALPSWPSRRPMVAMDRLYASSEIAVVCASVDFAARGTSDHLPLVVDMLVIGTAIATP